MLRRLALAAGLLVFLVAAHGAAWAWAVRRLDAGFAQWTLLQRAEGWVVSSGRPAPGGWPRAAELLVPDLAVATGDGALSWRGDLLLRVAPEDHRHLQVRPTGVQRVQAGDAPPIELTADAALGLVVLDAPEAIDLRAEGLRVRLPRGELTVAALRGRITGSSATLEADRIGLPAGLDWKLGAVVTSASLDAVMSAPVPAGAGLVERARRWGAAGGELQVRQAAVRWGRLSVEGSGAVTLDASLQPHAELLLRLAGYDGALDALGAAGLLPGGVLTAKAVLGLMAQRLPDGTASVELPLRLQDGVVQAGRIPLLRLPPLGWTAP